MGWPLEVEHPILRMNAQVKFPNGPRPAWRLRPARSDSPERSDLSQRGMIWDMGRIGLFDVAFDQEMVDDLGKVLQFGVSSAFPVFIKMVRLATAGGWAIRAKYAARSDVGTHETTLWTQPELPDWVKVRWIEDGNEESTPEENRHRDGRTEHDDRRESESGEQEEAGQA